VSNIAIKGADTGTGVFTLESPATNTDRTLVLPDEAGTVLTNASDLTGVTGVPNPLTFGTGVASTSGTAIDFTGIPSWVNRITVLLKNVSTNGSGFPMIQIGSGSITTSGYESTTAYTGPGSGSVTIATGFIIMVPNSTSRYSGVSTIARVEGNSWVQSGSLARVNDSYVMLSGGYSPTLSGALDRIRLTTSNGTDLFDSGFINIMYE
jgi:hypothetical protein